MNTLNCWRRIFKIYYLRFKATQQPPVEVLQWLEHFSAQTGFRRAKLGILFITRPLRNGTSRPLFRSYLLFPSNSPTIPRSHSTPCISANLLYNSIKCTTYKMLISQCSLINQGSIYFCFRYVPVFIIATILDYYFSKFSSRWKFPYSVSLLSFSIPSAWLMDHQSKCESQHQSTHFLIKISRNIRSLQ